ncbi:hypothetical protein D3C83_44840 [compost metagenome]
MPAGPLNMAPVPQAGPSGDAWSVSAGAGSFNVSGATFCQGTRHNKTLPDGLFYPFAFCLVTFALSPAVMGCDRNDGRA